MYNLQVLIYLKPFPYKSLFLHVCYISLLKTLWEKEKSLQAISPFFPQCFLPFYRTFSLFHQIQNFPLQTLSIWKSLKCVVWERVNKKFKQWSQQREKMLGLQKEMKLEPATVCDLIPLPVH